MADFWSKNDRFWDRGGSNDLYNDVLSVGLIVDCIDDKGKLNFAIISAQNSEIIENFFSMVMLLFVIFGCLSYTFLSDKIFNLSVQPVYALQVGL